MLVLVGPGDAVFMHTTSRWLSCSLVVVAAIVGCGTELIDDQGDAAAAGAFDAPGEEQGLARQCRPSQTLKGIDVSYYQERIDWNAAKNDGVVYAFIRVSDGSTFVDPRFQENWRNARAAGVKRGAYQFFRSNRDPIAQANLLLDQMGPLQPGDLPPVIDVESTDGQSRATVARKVGEWVAHVEARLGVRPIVYTGPYFWRDNVGSSAQRNNPLWIAHYGTECPLTPEPWTRWTFHQYTDRGRVAGIRGNVDMNVFWGSRADLDALGFSGDGNNSGGGGGDDNDGDLGCAAVPAAGRVIDDDDGCFHAGGPAQYLRAEEGEGFGGALIWTHTTANAARTNFAEWTIRLEAAGRYRLQAFTDSSVATSQLARYRVMHDGVTETRQLDQRAVDGFRDLGVFDFDSGSAVVALDDNTGEPVSGQKRLVFDAIRVVPDDGSAPPTTPPPAPEPSCAQLRVVNANALNVRPTPSTSQAAIGTLRSGDVVTRIDSVDGQSISGNRTWHRITRGALSGYVSSVYTRCTDG